MEMRNLYLIIAIALGAAGLAWSNHVPYIGDQLAADNEVIMYSLTTCGYCKETARKLRKSGIPFREYFLDKGEAANSEFARLLEVNNAAGGVVGTPSLKVNGVLLLNNPSLDEIRARLRYKSQAG